MMTALLIGSLTVVVTMSIQVAAVVQMVRYLLKKLNTKDKKLRGFSFDMYVISMVLLLLFFGHLIQMGIWAVLFVYLGEFSDYAIAFYHSMVNFSSLGYGDIVMSEEWRLLGAVEASNGVLMFGLSSGTMFAVMSNLFTRHDWKHKPQGHRE